MGLQSHQEDPMGPSNDVLTSIEICAGAGGQAIGLHQAGFKHLALVEIDPHAAKTLRGNIASLDEWSWERKYCDVISGDVNDFVPIPVGEGRESDVKKVHGYLGRPLVRGELDLLAGGVPCPLSRTLESSWGRMMNVISSRGSLSWLMSFTLKR